MAEPRAAIDRLAVTRRWIESTPSGDWVTGLRDAAQIARMQAFLEEHAAPEVEIEGMGGGGTGLVPATRGSRGLVGFWQDWLGPWDSFRIDVEDFREGSEGVLVEVVQRGRLRGSVAELHTPSAAVFFFSDRFLARIEFHLDRDTARRAAGL